VGDAPIAVLILEGEAGPHTADTNFRRFPGLRRFHPVAATGRAG
jgi:hypothetical protein